MRQLLAQQTDPFLSTSLRESTHYILPRPILQRLGDGGCNVLDLNSPRAHIRSVHHNPKTQEGFIDYRHRAGGIHAKLLLARIGAQASSAVGSLNGGGVSFKLNREVVLLLDSPAVYSRLHAVFDHDWQTVAGSRRLR